MQSELFLYMEKNLWSYFSQNAEDFVEIYLGCAEYLQTCLGFSIVTYLVVLYMYRVCVLRLFLNQFACSFVFKLNFHLTLYILPWTPRHSRDKKNEAQEVKIWELTESPSDMLCCAQLLSRVRISVTPWAVHSPPGSSIHGDSPGKNIGVSCHELLQGIVPIQGLNPGLPHCRQILPHLSHQGRVTYVKPSSAFLCPGPRMPEACIKQI